MSKLAANNRWHVGVAEGSNFVIIDITRHTFPRIAWQKKSCDLFMISFDLY